MSAYYEIVGFLPNGAQIQKSYDYGYVPPTDKNWIEGTHYGVHIYRLTYTNTEGIVYEFSAKQVQDYCKTHGLKSVVELYYGYANQLFDVVDEKGEKLSETNVDEWKTQFIEFLKKKYWYKQCKYCKNKVPNE